MKYCYFTEALLAFVCFTLLRCCDPVNGERRKIELHWNKSNPVFRIDNTDHVIDVNVDNLAWQHDQVNIVCPSKSAAKKAKKPSGSEEDEEERYIIYNVSHEEYVSCRITDPNPRVVAVCDNPSNPLYFTLTFRSFTPTPGGLEFMPGKDYYFISTSSPGNLFGKSEGRCRSHNMKVVFKVGGAGRRPSNKSGSARGPKHRRKYGGDGSLYYPEEKKRNSRKSERLFFTFTTLSPPTTRPTRNFDKKFVKQEASRMQSSVAASTSWPMFAGICSWLLVALYFPRIFLSQ